jgi:hypothetical protein
MAEMSFEEHASLNQRKARAIRPDWDCVHDAPCATQRLDALYAYATSLDLPWWEGLQGPFLMGNGRMVLVCNSACIFEP